MKIDLKYTKLLIWDRVVINDINYIVWTNQRWELILVTYDDLIYKPKLNDTNRKSGNNRTS